MVQHKGLSVGAGLGKVFLHIARTHLGPGAYAAVLLEGAVIGSQLSRVILYPVLGTHALLEGIGLHEHAYGPGRSEEGETVEPGQSLLQADEILINRNVLPEMEVFFELVGILVPHSVEIPGGEPFRLEDLFGAGESQGREHTALELIIGHPVFRTAGYVIETVPELLRHVVLDHIGEKPARILYGGPLQTAPHGNVESSGIHGLQYASVEYAALAQRHPVFQARIADYLLGHALRNRIHIVNAGPDRVAAAAPEQLAHTAAVLRDRTYIYKSYLVRILLFENGVHYKARRFDVRAEGLFRKIVRRRADHTADVEYEIGPCYALAYGFGVKQVAPDYAQIGIVEIGSEFLPVFLAWTGQDADVEAVALLEQFLQSLPAHIACGTGQKYCFFHR